MVNNILTALVVVAALSLCATVLSFVLLRELRAFRKTQNDLLIRVIIGGLADMEDKINLLLHDRGYTTEQINEWISSQKK